MEIFFSMIMQRDLNKTHTVLKQLSEKQQFVLAGKYLLNKTYREIAEEDFNNTESNKSLRSVAVGARRRFAKEYIKLFPENSEHLEFLANKK